MSHQPPSEQERTFEAWLCREMPAGTVIGDPAWWAPRIRRAVLLAAKEPETPKQPDSVHVACAGPAEGPKTALSDEQIDHVLAETLCAIAKRKGLEWNEIRTDIATHHTLRREFARAILAAAKGPQ